MARGTERVLKLASNTMIGVGQVSKWDTHLTRTGGEHRDIVDTQVHGLYGRAGAVGPAPGKHPQRGDLRGVAALDEPVCSST